MKRCISVSIKPNGQEKDSNKKKEGRPGGSASSASNFGSGHDLTVREFKPHVGLCADSSESGACFGIHDSLSLPLHTHALSLSKNK